MWLNVLKSYGEFRRKYNLGFPTQVNAEFKVVFQFQGSMTPVDENVDKRI